MAKMREMVEKRCTHACTDLDATFDSPETLDYLCEMSGGHPRHLMMFLQAACNEVDDLPLTRPAAEKAVRKYANSLLREVPDEAWEALKTFDTPPAGHRQGRSAPAGAVPAVRLRVHEQRDLVRGQPGASDP